MSVIRIHQYYDLSWSLSELWDFNVHPYMEGIVKYIEPKLVRGTFLPCWMWTGRLQYFNRGMINEYSYPTVYMPINLARPDHGRKLKYVHRYMAEQFWDFPTNWIVYRTCGHQDCVNPQHFAISYRNDPDHR